MLAVPGGVDGLGFWARAWAPAATLAMLGSLLGALFPGPCGPGRTVMMLASLGSLLRASSWLRGPERPAPGAPAPWPPCADPATGCCALESAPDPPAPSPPLPPPALFPLAPLGLVWAADAEAAASLGVPGLLAAPGRLCWLGVGGALLVTRPLPPAPPSSFGKIVSAGTSNTVACDTSSNAAASRSRVRYSWELAGTLPEVPPPGATAALA